MVPPQKFHMMQVVSSNIQSIGYDEIEHVLQVNFLNFSTYQYFEVPQGIFNGFRRAPSKGKFLHQNVKGRFLYLKI